jgi:hypothetical protein
MVYTSVRRLQLIIRPSLLYFSLPQLRQPLSNDLVENIGIFEMNPMGPIDGLKLTRITIDFASRKLTYLRRPVWDIIFGPHRRSNTRPIRHRVLRYVSVFDVFVQENAACLGRVDCQNRLR